MDIMTLKTIKSLANKHGVKQENEINLIVRAIKQKNNSHVQDIFVPKKWKIFLEEYENNLSSPSIYFRYPFKPLPPSNSPTTCVKCLIIGPCGTGKSCTINNICGSQLASGSASQSLTRYVTEVESFYKYELPFVFYDSPGTTANSEKLDHAVLVKQLLQHAPVNCVIILVKYTNRANDLIKSIYSQVKMLPGYQKNILFLITHFDLIQKTPQQQIDVIEKVMGQLLPSFNNQMLFFSNTTIKPKDLSDVIYNIARSLSPVSIKIDNKTFFKYFNLQKSQLQSLFFQASQKQVKTEMQDATDDFLALAKSLPDDNQRQAIFQDIQVVLKNQLLSLLDEFINKYKQTMLSCEYYETLYSLQLFKNDNLRRYQDQIRGLRKMDKFIESSASGSKLDIRDLIKQCPRCKQIWFRIEACPNTTCGTRPSCIFDYIKKPISRFKIVRDKKSKKVSFSKAQTQADFLFLGIKKAENEGKKFENIDVNKLNQQIKSGDKTIKQRMQIGKARGCGQAMNFESLPWIPNIDELLKEWYGTHTIEEVIEMFQRDEDLQRTRKEVQAKAKRSFLGFMY